MIQEKINNRRQYIEKIRQGFSHTNAEAPGARASSYEPHEDAENIPRGYFKLRLFTSVVLFALFVFIWKTGWSYGGWNAKTIQDKIQTSITLPESVSKLSDKFSFSD